MSCQYYWRSLFYCLSWIAVWIAQESICTCGGFAPSSGRFWNPSRLPLRIQASKSNNSRKSNASAAARSFEKPIKGGKKSLKTAGAAKSATPGSFSPETTPQTKRQPGRTKSTPPWQVLSSKEAAKNVEEEKARRLNLKDGVSIENSSSGAADNNNNKILSKSFLSESESKFLNWKRFNPGKVIQGQRFVGAYLDRTLPPRLGVPEVAFLGRSNVGKSSLLNHLSQTDCARVGKTPGATASVNLYALLDSQGRDRLGFTDLPGFGYAKLSKDVQESVMQAAEHYLNQRKELALGILLVDIRREPSNDDRAVLAALFDMGVPIVVVATKVDKIDSASQREQQLSLIQRGLGLPDGQPLTVSSVTGEGCRDVWRIIQDACETCVDDVKRKYSDQVLEFDDDEDNESDTEHDPWYDFDDNEDIAYDQGYEWIHGFADSDTENDEFNNEDSDDNDAAMSRSSGDVTDSNLLQPQRETLKSLQKKVKVMQKRGEI